jgi:hypothetical protein
LAGGRSAGSADLLRGSNSLNRARTRARLARGNGGRGVTPLKEALTALADALAKRPARKFCSTGFARDGWSANSLS